MAWPCPHVHTGKDAVCSCSSSAGWVDDRKELGNFHGPLTLNVQIGGLQLTKSATG